MSEFYHIGNQKKDIDDKDHHFNEMPLVSSAE